MPPLTGILAKFAHTNTTVQQPPFPNAPNHPYPAEQVVLNHFSTYLNGLGYVTGFVPAYGTEQGYIKFTRTAGNTTIILEVYTGMKQLSIVFERQRPEQFNLRWLVPIVQFLAVVLSPVIFLILGLMNILDRWTWAHANIINWRYKNEQLHYLLFPPARFSLRMAAHFYDNLPVIEHYTDDTLNSVAAAQLNFIKKHLHSLLTGSEWLKKKRR